MKTFLSCLVLLAALACTGAVRADMREGEIERLIEAKDHLLTGSQAVKPNQAARMRDQASELQKMIDQARSGKPLDPNKVERAVAEAYRAY